MLPFYKSYRLLVFFLLILTSPIYTNGSFAQSRVSIEYHFPMDGSKYVPPDSKIIIRPSGTVDAGSATASSIIVTGSSSGVHPVTALVSDDHRTIIFSPSSPFDLGEMVNVQLQNSLRLTDGSSLPPISFSFEVSPTEPDSTDEEIPFNAHPGNLSLDAPLSLPADFPKIEVVAKNDPAPGDIFLTTYNFFSGGSLGAYRMILDSLANPVYYAKPSRFLDWDFKLLPNKQFAFCQGGYSSNYLMATGSKYYIMDSNYVVRDSFDSYTANTPYTTDFHDLELLPNGHALMLGLAPLPGINMSKYVKNGKTNATVMGAVIEELDLTKTPIWIWRTWDPGHFLDTDATNDNFLEDTVDAVHANAIQVDTDGNVLLSSRSMDEITKINRFDTGSIIWRFGGKHNQFTFINDSMHFSHQHAIRRIANGHLTLYDNGNYGHIVTRNDTTIDSSVSPPDTSISPFQTPFARACEYDLNVENETATLVWHYDHDSGVASQAMGYVQRLDNGNTLINWGLNFNGSALVDQPAVTEVRPNGTIVYELHVDIPYLVYRAEKFVLPASSSAVNSTTLTNTSLVLGEPFPNPANGSSRVVVSAPASEQVALELYDPIGRKVREYFAGPLGMPISALELETGDLPNGAYTLVLRGEDATVSRQLVILR